MANSRVYVETTVPSFHYEERTAPAIVTRREWTQRWWDGALERYELVTSPVARVSVVVMPLANRQRFHQAT